MNRRLLSFLLLSAAMACAQANISDAKDITAEIVLTGATTVPIAVKQRITQQINQAAAKIGSLDSPEFLERVRDLFQQHGYFKASIGDPQWGPIQEYGKYRHVRITVAVNEGSLYKVGTITFKDNKVIDSQTLTSTFPLVKGDIFNVEKLRSGLNELRDAYRSKGYIDATPVPNLEIHSETNVIDIVFTMDEGKQYRVGNLHLDGPEPKPARRK
jgi:outer membrane translocation and assembly module TamA